MKTAKDDMDKVQALERLGLMRSGVTVVLDQVEADCLGIPQVLTGAAQHHEELNEVELVIQRLGACSTVLITYAIPVDIIAGISLERVEEAGAR